MPQVGIKNLKVEWGMCGFPLCFPFFVHWDSQLEFPAELSLHGWASHMEIYVANPTACHCQLSPFYLTE